METTRFRVWLKSGVRTDWTGVKLVRPPEYISADVVHVTVAGDGSDLMQLIADRPDIFAAYLQLKPQEL